MDKKYKFKEIKVFSSTESMAGNTRRYRTVFDNKETTYLYAELTFYNKLFDEEDWECKVNIKAFKLNSNDRKELCDMQRDIKVSKDQNIVTVREGWGNKEPGKFWVNADYEYEAFIDGESIGKVKFNVENVGIVTPNNNPFFNLKSVRIYEGPGEGIKVKDRKYLTKFNAADTRFLWVEVNIENLIGKSWYCELFFNYYNDSGQLKGGATEKKFINGTDSQVMIPSGWGSSSKGTWHKDNFRLEITFMDQLIAVVPFEMGDEYVEGDAPLLKAGEFGAVTSQSKNNFDEASLEDVVKSLNELIGLTSVKQRVSDYISYIKFLQLREKQGFEENQKFSLHSVFTGNPGTGKTTVAKMMGQIYHKMGLLSKGNVTEVGRAELVGKYIGQTAPQTKEWIEKARGGVLFIDEAYALMREGDSGNDFGQEVVEVLLKEMSDGKGDIAIIVAGYPQEMDHFLTANPGLKSRFNLFFHFDDYLPQELIQIAQLVSQKKNVELSVEAQKEVYERITEAYRTRDNSFGNARLITSWIDEAKMNLGLRLMKSPDISKLTTEVLKTIELEDIDAIFKTSKKEIPDIRIDEELLAHTLNELNSMIGLNEVKDEIHEIVKLVRFYKETGKDVLNKFSLHTVFKGNPGTGKTTVARMISQIFKALGILERGHIVEVDRQGLVAGYVGQTANKTKEAIERAMGGVLFIDEAYSLSQGGENDFGREAIETLLKMMEDRRGQFVVIVAGYTDNMNTFLEMNPGLKSRFDKTIHFEDYKTDELFNIATQLLAKENLSFNEVSSTYLNQYLQWLYERRDKFFGNARSVRKIIKEVVSEQHLRMASIPASDRTPQQLSTVILEDLKDFKMEDNNTAGNQTIGFKMGGSAT